jgi:hypothetical protein
MTSGSVRVPRTWLGRALRPDVDSSRAEIIVGLVYAGGLGAGCLVSAVWHLVRGERDFMRLGFTVLMALAFASSIPDCLYLLRRDRGLGRP